VEDKKEIKVEIKIIVLGVLRLRFEETASRYGM
jgi:hypothetical protein